MRKLGLIIAGIFALSYGASASAQTSQLGGFNDNDDSFLQDLEDDELFEEQRRLARERRALGREVSPTAQRYLTVAAEAAQEGEYNAVVIESEKGLSEHGLTPYEKSVLLQLNAAGHLMLKNYSKAKTSYKLALVTQGMNEEETKQVNTLIAELDAAGIE